MLLEFAIPLAKDVWPKLTTKAASSVLDKFGKKWESVVITGKGFTLFLSNEDMDDIIKIV